MSREVPEGWRATALGEITQITGGSTPSKSEGKYWQNGAFCWATPSDITALDAGFPWVRTTKHLVTDAAIRETSLRLLPAGSVMMTSRATVGFPAVNLVPMATNQGFANFLPASTYDAGFLVQWITWKRNDLRNAAGGSTFLEISKSTLKSFSIALPPLHEQRRIAEILLSVDEAIAATRAVIEQTRKVKQAVLERLLTKGIGHTRFKQTEIGEIPEGWEVARIEAYLARLIDYRGVPPPKADSGVPLITAKNVRFGYLNPEPREYISEFDFDSWMRRGVPEAGDVLFTTEAPLGNVASVPDYKVALGQRTITLCPDRCRLFPSFLKWLLLSPQSQTRIAENATGSTALGIKQSTFRRMLFPFPPKKEQVSIASHMDEIAGAEDREMKKLEAVLMAKSALMSDLLTGRRRVTDALPLAAE